MQKFPYSYSALAGNAAGLWHFCCGATVSCFFCCGLSQCSIKEEGCNYLASALQKNPGHLKVLDLSINVVRDKGANGLF